jgi:aconitase A
MIDWDDKSEDEEEHQEEKANSVNEEEIHTEIKKSPKRAILKDKTGEILITKLEQYVEPTRAVRETRGDNSKYKKIFIKKNKNKNINLNKRG